MSPTLTKKTKKIKKLKRPKIAKVPRAPANAQYGKVQEDNVPAKFGEVDGTILKQDEICGVKIRYEQASCSCNGDNEKCMRCDGTGYYAKKIIENSNEESSRLKTENFIKYNIKSRQESRFSNDLRGGDYGIREDGRFNSNPLYDDDD